MRDEHGPVAGGEGMGCVARPTLIIRQILRQLLRITLMPLFHQRLNHVPNLVRVHIMPRIDLLLEGRIFVHRWAASAYGPEFLGIM